MENDWTPLCQSSVCVSCVPASCVHIWFVSCPCQMWLLVNCVQLCLSRYLWFTCVFIVLSVQLIWSGLLITPGVSCLSALPCPALSSLKTIIWVYVLVCVSLFLPAVCTVTPCLPSDDFCPPSTCLPLKWDQNPKIMALKHMPQKKMWFVRMFLKYLLSVHLSSLVV